MKEPTTYEKVHWIMFNLLVRVFGVGLVVISTFFIILTMAPIIGLHNQVTFESWLLVLFIPLIALGVLIIKAKKYYPKKYKEYYENNS